MKILLNLTSDKVSFEYMDTVPFIQGTDSRNKIYLYREYSATPALTNLSISYQVQSGRYTLPLGNTSATSETIDGVVYNKWTFNVPAAATAVAGNIVACLVVKTATGQYKLNILNNVLDSSEFDAFESGLTGAAATYAEAMDNLSSANTIQDQRILALENAGATENAKFGLLNTEVFGTSSGETTNDGLKYIVRTDHEGRLDTLEALNISSRLTALEASEIGYFTLSGSTGTITTDNLQEVLKHDCIIYNNGYLFIKNIVSGNTVEFIHLKTTLSDNNVLVEQNVISINTSTRAFTTSNYLKNLLGVSNVVNALDSTETTKPLSAAQGKYLNDELETLKAYIYQGSQNGVIDRLKEVLDFLAGESESTTLLSLLAAKANASDVYTKSQADTLLNAKANASTTYTKTEVNNIADTKADKSTTYTKTETNTLLNAKANSADVYTKQQVYTKTEVNGIVEGLVVEGYEMPYDEMLAIFNDAYSTDPVVTALNALNGEVV